MILTHISQYNLTDAAIHWYRVNDGRIPRIAILEYPGKSAIDVINLYVINGIADKTGKQTLAEGEVICRLIIECLVQDNLTLSATIERVSDAVKGERMKQKQLAAVSR